MAQRSSGSARRTDSAPAFATIPTTTLKALLGFVHAARVRGYAMIDEVFAPRMSAVATPVVSGSRCVGVISPAGPRVRLTTGKIHQYSGLLREAANELAQLNNMAGFSHRPPLGKG
ncbi:IclR family transcriptional regulator domain-containing protein [Paraburkholderia unamae]|uniref:IclR family transcriptional regulator domain-containing protein n=1 Tax=Paraburkholderia unamae TaxID=219649 RepID=UPI003CCC6B5D